MKSLSDNNSHNINKIKEIVTNYFSLDAFESCYLFSNNYLINLKNSNVNTKKIYTNSCVVLVENSFKINKLLNDPFVKTNDTIIILLNKKTEVEINTDEFVLWISDNIKDKLFNTIKIYKKRKFLDIHSDYLIQGINTDNDHHSKVYQGAIKSKFTFQQWFYHLITIINNHSCKNKSGCTFVRCSDGDFYFLEAIPVGSAIPGRRALKRAYSYPFILKYRKLFLENNYLTFDIDNFSRQMWFFHRSCRWLFILSMYLRIPIGSKFRFHSWSLLKKLSSYFYAFKFTLLLKYYEKNEHFKLFYLNAYIPSEVIYALVSTRFIFRKFPDEIVIIGSKEKIDLISELSRHDQYRNYLGLNSFNDLIPIPQIGAADNVDDLANTIGTRLKKLNPKIILVGVGSVKLALLPLLRDYSNALILDVGCGIDAIAGIVCQDRPYFADWINFRIRDYPYEKIDFMDQGNPKWSNKNYKTVYIH